MRIVYSPQLNFGLGGIERYLLASHPFDPCKYARAWRLARKRFGRKADSLRIAPQRAASSTRSPQLVARTVEALVEKSVE
jgi:hypothetical protein